MEDKTKEIFAKKLQSLMLARGWNQSELGRRAGTIGRDNISGYLNKKCLPKPKHLKKLADAFGISPNDLLPGIIISEIDNEKPALEMKQMKDDPNMVKLRLVQVMPMKVAMKIMQIIRDDSEK